MTFDQRMHQASNEVRDTFNGRTGPPVSDVVRYKRTLGLATFVAVIAVVVIAVGSVALNTATQPPNPVAVTTVPAVTTTTVPEQPETTVVTAPNVTAPMHEGLVTVRRDPVSGDLIGLRDFEIVRSGNGGRTWTQIHSGVQGDNGSWSTDGGDSWAYTHGGVQFEALDVSGDGSIIAIENWNSTRSDDFGPDAFFNDPPLVHLYDPATNEWSVTELPRPELPIAGLAPAPTDGFGACPFGGLMSLVDGVAVTFGEQIVIVGSHRVVGEGICDEEFPFFWISTDGIEWTIIPDTGTETYLNGLVWTGVAYVAYGTGLRSFFGPTYADLENLSGSLSFLTSTDLSTWTQIAIDLTVLPDNVIVYSDSFTSTNPDVHAVGLAPTPSGTLAFVFPVLSVSPKRPGAELADVEELLHWFKENSFYHSDIPGSEQAEHVRYFLDFMNVDFPLDIEESNLLWSFYVLGSSGLEPVGHLYVERMNDGEWSTTFSN